MSEVRQRRGIETLPLTESAALRLSGLPAHHHDPFDRMLICQSLEHQLLILTPDPEIQRYPITTLW